MLDMKMKRRVKTNVWGNINGYEGNKKVKEFNLGTTDSEIKEWIEEGNKMNTKLPIGG
jgi:hypothetical protein